MRSYYITYEHNYYSAADNCLINVHFDVFNDLKHSSNFKFIISYNTDKNTLPDIYAQCPMHICDQICQKGSYTRSFKTHFSSPSVRYINAPTAHVFNTVKG